MAYPTTYDKTYSYTGFQQGQGDNTFPGTAIDTDLEDIENALDSLGGFVQQAFNSDGSLKPSTLLEDAIDYAEEAAASAAAADLSEAAAELAETNAEAAAALAATLASGFYPAAATRSALLALNTTLFPTGYLREALREGVFKFESSDQSTLIHPISAVTSTAVDSGTETFTKTAHGLRTGYAVLAQTAVNGLSLNTLYYVIWISNDTFRLATSRANARAGTAINLTGTTNMPFKVHKDPAQGVIVTPTADLSGASGAWIRVVDGRHNVGWWGATGDGTTDDTDALEAALAYADVSVTTSAFNLTGGLTLWFPRRAAGRYMTSAKQTFRGDGVHLEGEGVALATSTDAITILEIGDPTYTGQTYDVVIDGIEFLGAAMAGVYTSTASKGLVCHDVLFSRFENLWFSNLYEAWEWRRLNTCVINNINFTQSQRTANKAAYGIALMGRTNLTGTTLTSGNNKIGRIEFHGAAAFTPGEKPWTTCVKIMSADGAYFEHGHWAEADYLCSIEPDGTNDGNTISDISFDGIFFDLPGINCLRIIGEIDDLTAADGIMGTLQNITVGDTCRMTGSAGNANSLINVSVDSVNASTQQVGDFTFNAGLRQAGLTAVSIAGPASGKVPVYRAKVGGSFEDNNQDDGATQSAISANCVDLQVCAKFGPDAHPAQRLITFTAAADSGYGLTTVGSDFSQSNCSSHASFDGSYINTSAVAGLRGYIGANSIGLAGIINMQPRAVPTTDATPRTIFSRALAVNQQLRLSGTVIVSSPTGAYDGEWVIKARCVRIGSATAIDRETPSVTLINASNGGLTVTCTRSTNTVAVTVTGIAATNLVWTFIPDLNFVN